MDSFFRQIKAVTFDVGYTILFPARPVGEMYAAVLYKYGVKIEPAILEKQFFESWRHHIKSHKGLIYGTTHEEALYSWSAIIRHMLHSTYGHYDFPVRQIATELYDLFSHKESWSINPHWFEMLAYCRKQNWKVGLLSNWDLRLVDLLDSLSLTPKVDFQIISAECAVEKPDPAIFSLAVKKAGISPQTLLHIGDTWNDDIEGATNFGAKAVWLNSHCHPRPEIVSDDVFIIDCFSEIYEST